MKFENAEQISLVQFLNVQLGIKGVGITIPTSPKDCRTVLAGLKADYKKYLQQVASQLKTHRSKSSPLSIYNSLILR